ncbi:MAG TPA: HPF/RaiA family ribosome-associated protein [Xanthomonadaceae bacterium]|nr:HPF/RaiA family ribosome-associated protein [Xanthomonadaceae bacterium]
MKILINTDHNLQTDESVVRHVEDTVENHLGRYADQVTRIEVHLRDENAAKGGAHDKHCTMEARLEGRPPLAVSDDSETLAVAINGAAKKLQRALGNSLGKLG